ncbi:ankyrin repeat domain-containing protein 6-like isoform X2 [Clytia hemisphaerica]|uniref:ankyrin repeat domain-containing protein 6-like isoform X2 n=1 Tax=Clytia hemisphaerica TaxID=252671 RepID=UPI0034D7ACB6
MDDSDDTLKLHRDLIIACGWGKEVDVILLLQQGASVRVQDQDGKNCLHYAACKGHIQVTNLLIENGCNINARDKEGNTPCHVACLNDYFEVVELLIHVKADLNIKNKDAFTPLHIATLNHHTKSMVLLMKAGVNKSAQDANGNTALHMAIQTKSYKALKCLLKHGADVNIQNHGGNTPLHLSAELGNAQYVDYLLSVDQPIELSPNNVGDTAKDIAIRNGFKEIAQMIPEPNKKKRPPKERRKHRSSDSPTISPAASLASPANPPPHLTADDLRKTGGGGGSQCGSTASTGSPEHSVPTTYIQHPSEELPTATSSSVLSLFVPTTDSGISIPMDARGDQTPLNSSSRRKSFKTKTEKTEKPHLYDELQLYDSHRKDKQKQKDKQIYPTPKHENKYVCHEYKELRYDPRFMSPQITPKHRMNMQVASSSKHKSDRYSDHGFVDGYISEESIQAKGCFFSKSKQKKGKSSKDSKNDKKLKDVVETSEKELMIHRQAELQYQLNASKHSLEKQMRKMRKKFERALQATDDRFLEQKRREESFHNQLRNELEIIEQSLERGSKKNVDEFTHHIRTELNSLAERLTKGIDIKSSDDTDEPGSPAKRLNKRESAVDLDRNISVSLQNCESPRKGKKKHSDNNNMTDETIIQDYEERLKALEQERQQKESTEKENEELRARVLELERLVRANNGSTAVT